MANKFRKRDTGHREWVASLPCATCGVEGRSQCAHIKDGSGTVKPHDGQCLPLCSESPDGIGCHRKQHGTSEAAFYMPYGGIEKALEVANALWVKTGDDSQARLVLSRFRNRGRNGG